MAKISSAISKGASWIPMKWVRPLSGVSLVVPFYHMVSDSHVPHVSNLYRFRSVAEFRADLEFFLRNFKAVTLNDIVDDLNGKKALSGPCVHLTFDDGFSEVHDIIAPILEEFGVPATFFLNTAFLDGGGLAHYNAISVLLDQQQLQHPGSDATKARLEAIVSSTKKPGATLTERVRSIGYSEAALVGELAETLQVDLDEYVRDKRPHLTSGQIERLIQKGFSIGAHSHDHPLYSELPLAEQLSQTRKSIEILDDRFHVTHRAFAFPHNDSGVQDEFFSAVYSEPMLDVSFGTSGLVRHFHPRNIERVSMEKTAASAEQIVARQFTRAAYFRMRIAMTAQ